MRTGGGARWILVVGLCMAGLEACGGNPSKGGTGGGTATGGAAVAGAPGMAAPGAGGAAGTAGPVGGAAGSCGAEGQACCAGGTCADSSLSCLGIGCGCAVACASTPVSAGSTDDLFVTRQDGTVWYYAPVYGVLAAPTLALPFSTLSFAASGPGTYCGVKNDNTVWCEASAGSWGELGNGTDSPSATPVQVVTAPGGPPLTNITKVFASNGSTLPTFCAIDTSQVLWCWGSGVDGVLGNGSTTESNVAAPVLASQGGPPFAPVAQVSIGMYSACAVKTDHTLWCWGGNNGDQLGIGSNELQSLYPVQVGSLSSLVMNVSVFDTAACAVRSDGTVWCWGSAAYGQLGTEASSNGFADSPVQILTTAGGSPLSNVKSVNVMEYSACAVKTDSSLWCWGAGLGGGHSLLPALWSENGNAVTAVVSLGLGTICPCFIASDASVHTDGSSGGTQPLSTPISCE